MENTHALHRVEPDPMRIPQRNLWTEESSELHRHFHSAQSKALVAIADVMDRARTMSALENLECEVDAVTDGYRLLQLLADAILEDIESARPRLIVAEIFLPGCTGLSLLAGIRDLGWDTPVILIAQHDHEAASQRAWELGATGVFVEPFDRGELYAFSSLVLHPGNCAAIHASRLKKNRPSTLLHATRHGTRSPLSLVGSSS